MRESEKRVEISDLPSPYGVPSPFRVGIEQVRVSKVIDGKQYTEHKEITKDLPFHGLRVKMAERAAERKIDKRIKKDNLT